MVRYIPNLLVFLRVIIAVFLIIDAGDGIISAWFVALFAVAAISDLIDGPIARRFNATSVLGSRLDSYGDVVLVGAILFCIWKVHRDVVYAFWVPITTIGITQVTSWLISLIKFSKITSYHSYIAKIWALAIFIAAMSLFAFDYARVLFWIVIVLGIISNIEDIIITFILPYWACDILTVGQAVKLRKDYLAAKKG